MTDHPKFPHIVTVKSSAGAGKTYRLALRYLELLTMDDAGGEDRLKSRLCNIVAITFTNKAASEMRSRIIDWMKRIILDIPFSGTTRKPADQIPAGQGSPAARARLIKRVEEDFENLIRNFYDFKVSTIDSFVNLTLKASAFKLGLPPDFDISTDSALYVDAVLQECLQEILEDQEVRRQFDAFLRSYVEMEGENAAWAPKRFLTETVYHFWKEETKENREFLRGPGRETIETLRRDIARESTALLGFLGSTEGMKVQKNFLGALAGLSVVDTSDFKGSAYFKRPTVAQSLNKGSAPPEEAWEDLWQRIRGLIARFVETVAETKFSSYLEIYDLFKDRLRGEVTYRQRVILIEELNKLLQEVICGEHFIPEIYYALAERYSHFLIDEFQDTNHLQWKNIAILADEALSRGGTLFLVGDKKQAIYRWRGGKAELVDHISAAYPAYPTYPLHLDTNYRSEEFVVAFNNALFDPRNMVRLLRAAARDDVPSEETDRVVGTFEGSAQSWLEGKSGSGFVHVEKVKDDNDDDEEDFLPKEEQERVITDRVEALVREVKERGGYENRDIAVLVRRRHEAELVVKKLLEAGTGVESEFTVNVKNNPLVKELIAFLQFLSAPSDDTAFAGFLTGSVFSGVWPEKKGTVLSWIARQRLPAATAPLYRSFGRDFPALWERYFADFFKGAGYLPLYELFVLILKRWSVPDRFPEHEPYLLHVCEMITKREGPGGNNLTGFLQFWKGGGGTSFADEREDETPFLLKITEGADAVRVLTIHKAKGLQFGVVILPFLKLTGFGSADRRDKGKFFVARDDGLKLLYIKKDSIDYSPALRDIYTEKEMEYLADEANNAYVACTRAEKELYILLPDSARQRNHLIDYIFSTEAFQPFVRGNVIEIGQKRVGKKGLTDRDEGEIPPGKGERERESLLREIPVFREGIRWMEKIGGKFEPSEGCSKEQVWAKKKGDVIHYILSLIAFLPGDPDTFLDEVTRRGVIRFGLADHYEETRGIMDRFFRHLPFREFFLPSEGSISYTEKELVDRRGDAYKADRIVVRSGHVDVVDFKTGETRSRAHRDQIGNYARLVGEIHQGSKVRAHLLYMDENEVETL